MTDGNMATISPVSEGEMEQIQSLFKKAADTLVAYASISGQVEKLQAQVNDLANQVTRYRNHIDTQDDAMYRLRQEREELTNAKMTAERIASDAKREVDEIRLEREVSRVRIDDLQTQVEQLKKDRDDAELRAMEFEDKYKASEASLGKFRELAVALLPQATVPTPTPTLPIEPVVEQAWWSKPSEQVAKDPEPDQPTDPWSSAQRATS